MSKSPFTKMYRRIPWELIADALISAKHTLGTNGLDHGARKFLWHRPHTPYCGLVRGPQVEKQQQAGYLTA